MTTYLSVSPIDPIIARDGRPFGFGQGNRMRSLRWPHPSTATGSLRTLLAKRDECDFTPKLCDSLRSITVAGPLPVVDERIYFPAPLDALVVRKSTNDDEQAVYPLRPMRLPEDGTIGCDLPDGLQPVVAATDLKAVEGPSFWSTDRMTSWLLGKHFDTIPKSPTQHDGFLGRIPEDQRTQVSIDAQTGSAEEGHLFSTVALDMTDELSGADIELALRIEENGAFIRDASAFDETHPFGGERRLATWSQGHESNWAVPAKLYSNLHQSNSNRLRMILASPAIFAQGWKPGWLDHDLTGQPPGSPDNTKVRLVAACVGRWQAISGWSLEKGTAGPKAVRRAVPAGSVYCFEILEGDIAAIAEKLWLHPVSDNEQDRRDGFGLALWGKWDWASNENGGII